MTDPFELAAARADRATRERREERTARSRRRQRYGFRVHACAFLAVQVLLVGTWFVVSRTGGTSYPWFVFPLLGWTVALVVHFAAVSESYGRA